MPIKPILFLDLDDVICLNEPYGGYDVFAPDPPADLFERLFEPTAVDVLLRIVKDCRPAIVITSSWLRFLDRQAAEQLFKKTGMGAIAGALHERWDAPQDSGATRLNAIEAWLSAYHQGEPFGVLDDRYSGTGLEGSPLDKACHVVLCEVSVGLQERHVATVSQILNRKFVPDNFP